jgi:carboxypeptidase A2
VGSSLEEQVVISDVEEFIRAASKTNNTALTSSSANYDPFYSDFRTLTEVESYVANLASKYPSLVSVFDAGTTVEGRNIEGLRISTGGSGKPVFYSQATVHAREWLATPTLLFVVEQLMEAYEAGDASVAPLVDAFDFVIVPLVNKDGYEFTHTSQRLWRKNRSVNPGSNSLGTDLNRNWGPADTWCSAGSSTNPGSDTYCGSSVFSEPETRAMRDLMNGIDNLAMAIDWHSYSDLLLSPFQYSYTAPPATYQQSVLSAGTEMCLAINAVHGSRFRSIQGVDLYPHSGGMVDYCYLESGAGQAREPLAYTFELRGNSFIVPAGDIILSGEENYAGIVKGLEMALEYLN